MPDHEAMAFEPGATFVEFLRVVGESCFRKGFEVGFTTGVAWDSGNTKRGLLLATHRLARQTSPTLSVEWKPEGEGIMMLVTDDRDDECLPLIGVSRRTYDTLNALELTREDDDD